MEREVARGHAEWHVCSRMPRAMGLSCGAMAMSGANSIARLMDRSEIVCDVPEKRGCALGVAQAMNQHYSRQITGV